MPKLRTLRCDVVLRACLLRRDWDGAIAFARAVGERAAIPGDARSGATKIGERDLGELLFQVSRFRSAWDVGTLPLDRELTAVASVSFAV
jgi:hypothetical protein